MDLQLLHVCYNVDFVYIFKNLQQIYMAKQKGRCFEWFEYWMKNTYNRYNYKYKSK